MDWKKNGKIINIFPLSIRIWKSEEMKKKYEKKWKFFKLIKTSLSIAKEANLKLAKA